MKLAGAWLVALGFCGACYSLALVQEPKVLPLGAVRGSLGFGFNELPLPSLQLAARAGLGAGTEARLKLVTPGNGDRGLAGLEAGFNVQPFDSELVGIFLMPHYRFYAIAEDYDDAFDEDYSDNTRIVHAFAMPTLAVFHLEPYELFVGPDLHVGTRQHREFLGVGGHAGASIACGRFVHLTLETALFGSVLGPDASRDEYGGPSQSVLTVGNLMSEIGFSVSVGSPYVRGNAR